MTSSLTWLNMSHGIMPPMWLNVSHSFYAKCHTFEVPCGLPLPFHVSSNTPRLEKREIPTTSESDEIRHSYQISRDDFNGEVRFVIRDLEKILDFYRNYDFSFFEKIGFSRGFTPLGPKLVNDQFNLVFCINSEFCLFYL